MSGQAFIGGNLQSIEESAGRLDQSGAAAITSGDTTATAAGELNDAITEAMDRLIRTFETIAGDLETDISASHGQLVRTDWQGASRDNAVAIKEQLQSQVKEVMGSATSNLTAERNAFTTRAGELLDSINGEFKTVMRRVDEEYAGLAAASRKTRDNLMAADATIMMG